MHFSKTVTAVNDKLGRQGLEDAHFQAHLFLGGGDWDWAGAGKGFELSFLHLD